MSLPKIRIRRVTDLSIIRQLDTKIFGAYEDLTLSSEELNNTKWWLASHNKKPIGFAGGRQLTIDPDLFYLAKAGVLPAYRGKGLHRRLIHVRTRRAREIGCKEAVTYTMLHNYVSSNNLIKTGFRLYDPENQWVGNDDVLYWCRDLRKKMYAL